MIAPPIPTPPSAMATGAATIKPVTAAPPEISATIPLVLSIFSANLLGQVFHFLELANFSLQISIIVNAWVY